MNQQVIKRGLVLASGSPRRKELLTQVGLQFVIDQPDIDETQLLGESPAQYVSRLSCRKAEVVAARNPEYVVVAADTTVVLNNDILGKPESQQHGLDMLRRLSGTTHEVLTGVAVVSAEQSESFISSSEVVFRSVSEEEIKWYWNTGEPVDKAGGYGLQGIGAAFVSEISGSYTNVIGLPLAETLLVLREFGISAMQADEEDLLKNQDSCYV